MKKINILIISSITLFFIISCEKNMLEKRAYDQRVIGNFYRNSTEALEALVAVYDILQHDGWNNIHMIGEVASDNCTGGSGVSDGPGLQSWNGFTHEIDLNSAPWQKYFQGIYRANLLLDNIGAVTWERGEEDLEVRYTSEARFLRAYFYFDLVRMFGNVPLFTKVLPVDEAIAVPQADPVDVYKAIAEDLKYAVEHLPSVAYQGPNPESGRVTKWAAEALLSRVYLYYTGYYKQSDLVGIVTKAEARAYIDDIINNSGHGLVVPYTSLWQYSDSTGIGGPNHFAGEDNKETVFSIKFTYQGNGNWNLQDGNRWQIMIGCRNQTIIPYATGWGFATINPEFWNAWPDDDPRKRATIISWDELGVIYDVSDQREYTGYHWRKYVALADSLGRLLAVYNFNGDNQIDNYFDEIVVRFADVLLMGAELHLDDNLSLAQTYFDRVRDRAYGDDQHRITLTNDATGIHNIMEERRWELALENVRYWDLLRQGLDVAKAALDIAQMYPVNFRHVTEGLFEIPETQINLSNGALKQNPGW